MPDKRFNPDIPVLGDLDTSLPVSGSPTGTLVEAKDVSSRAWGPRLGNQSFTRLWESTGNATLYDEITLTGDAGASPIGVTHEDQFRDLGTTFTLDIWFRLTDLAYAAGLNVIGLYGFNTTDGGNIDVTIRGPAHADHEKIRVEMNVTGGATVGFTGSTRLTAGSTQTHKNHIRVVRNGATATLYLNGVSDGSTSSLSATGAMRGSYGTQTLLRMGMGTASGFSTRCFKGQIFGAVLRDGAFATQPIEATMPVGPWARGVHHYILGRSIAYGGDVHFFDAGRFGVHVRVGDAAYYTVSAANDDAAPAPAIVQGLTSWTTKTNRNATSVMAGGQLCTAVVS